MRVQPCLALLVWAARLCTSWTWVTVAARPRLTGYPGMDTALYTSPKPSLDTFSEAHSPQGAYRSHVVSGSQVALAGVASLLAACPAVAVASIEEGAKGYRSVLSPYAPASLVYPLTPPLPQSALINSLPVPNALVGEIQANVESFVQLLSPTPEQVKQIGNPNSILWLNLRVNAQKAAGMFLYNRAGLLPSPDDSGESREKSLIRQKAANLTISTLQIDLLRLVNASRRSSVPDSLRCMRYALNTLAQAAYLAVPAKVVSDLSLGNAKELDKELKRQAQESTAQPRIPRLVGRCTVTLELALLGREKTQGKSGRTLVRIVVDGINHPFTGGHFVDLAQEGKYDGTVVSDGPLDVNTEGGGGESDRWLVLGKKATDPSRRIPLEILREDGKSKRRFTAYGAARNSAVFSSVRESTSLDESSKSPTVNSFATLGAIGLYHPKGDLDGGAAAFFVVPPDPALTVVERTDTPAFRKLNSRYSLFAYCIDRNDVLQSLVPGDVLVSVTVEKGVWELVRS